MRQITLNVNDSMLENFLYLIKHLDSSEIQIVDEKPLIETLANPTENRSLKSKMQALLNSNPGVFADIKDPVAWQQEQRGLA